jgi:hypothetical protein
MDLSVTAEVLGHAHADCAVLSHQDASFSGPTLTESCVVRFPYRMFEASWEYNEVRRRRLESVGSLGGGTDAMPPEGRMRFIEDLSPVDMVARVRFGALRHIGRRIANVSPGAVMLQAVCIPLHSGPEPREAICVTYGVPEQPALASSSPDI